MPTPQRPLRIAYVTTYDSREVRHWSGSGYHIAHALEQVGQVVLRIGPLAERTSWWLRQKRRIAHHLRRRHHPFDREPAVLDHYAHQVSEHLTKLQADVVFSPGIIPIAHLTSGLPQVTWTDATFAAVADAYPEFSRLSDSAIRQAHQSERAAIAHNALSIYTSRWAADSAINAYGADPTRVAVVPFGANIDSPITDVELPACINARLAGPLRLLFIGIDWNRKGGPQTLEVLRHLRAQGCPATLCVIGCQPKIPEDLRTAVEVLGFISKHDESGRARLAEEFRRATVLVLLSAHECFGLVLCEACAHGLPSMTTTADGIPTIIRDGVNGVVEPFGTAPEQLATRLLTIVRDRERYGALCRQALASYQTDFNWTIAGQRIVHLLNDVVERHHGR